MDLRIRSFKQAAFWSTAINAFGQGLALVFSMIMAAVFGAQESTDILYYCLGMFLLLVGMTQTVNVGVLIPETMRRRVQTGERDAMAFINRFMALLVGVVVLLSAGLLWNPAGALAAVSKFPAEVLERNSVLLLWLALSFPLQMISQLLLDILISYRFLTLPATLSCVSRSLNLVFVVVFHEKLGVVSVAMGMVLGYALQLVLNLYLLRRMVGWRFGAWRAEPGRRIWQNMFWAEAGTVASAVSNYLVLFLSSGFGAGILTALSYASRMSSMPIELLTTQVSSVTAVKFNELAAQQEDRQLGCAYGRISRLLVAVLTPLSFLMALVGAEIIQILYGRGAFRGSVGLTAGLFSVFVLVLPLHAMAIVLARLLIAKQRVQMGAVWQILSSLLFMGLIFGFVRWLGPMGLAWGGLVHLVLYLAVLSPFVARVFPFTTMWPVWLALVRTWMACGLAAGLAWAVVAGLLPGQSCWLAGPIKVVVFTSVYGLLLGAFPPDRESQRECRSWVRGAWGRLGKIRDIPGEV